MTNFDGSAQIAIIHIIKSFRRPLRGPCPAMPCCGATVPSDAYLVVFADRQEVNAIVRQMMENRMCCFVYRVLVVAGDEWPPAIT